MKTLFERGDFTLHGGGKSRWRINAEGLSDEDWDALVIAARPLMIGGRPRTIVGIPSGGLAFAAAIERAYPVHPSGGGVLIVDDVLTTGRSMAEARLAALSDSPQSEFRNSRGLVAFARGPLPGWVRAIWKLG